MYASAKLSTVSNLHEKIQCGGFCVCLSLSMCELRMHTRACVCVLGVCTFTAFTCSILMSFTRECLMLTISDENSNTYTFYCYGLYNVLTEEFV